MGIFGLPRIITGRESSQTFDIVPSKYNGITFCGLSVQTKTVDFCYDREFSVVISLTFATSRFRTDISTDGS